MHLDRLAGDDDVKGDDESYSVTLKCAVGFAHAFEVFLAYVIGTK
jgi:hypothetical protein